MEKDHRSKHDPANAPAGSKRWRVDAFIKCWQAQESDRANQRQRCADQQEKATHMAAQTGMSVAE